MIGRDGTSGLQINLLTLALVPNWRRHGRAPISVLTPAALKRPEPRLVVRRRTLSEISPEIWDDFAQACGASIRCSHGFVAAWALKRFGRCAVHLFEIFLARAGEPLKIGQAAVATSGGGNVFLERLQLLPSQGENWDAAMAALLAEVGPGDYEYGGYLEIEPCRSAALAAVSGVTVSHVRPITVQYVDFSAWPTWAAYYRAISENSRRNAKAAERRHPTLRTSISRGRRAALSSLDMVSLRTQMTRRKNLAHDALHSFLSYVGSSLMCHQHMFVAMAKAGRRPLAFFYGAHFGQHAYYLEGASIPDNQGAAWRLMLDMLERAYHRAPDGKFVMGYVDYALHIDEVGGGLLRSRRACRVSDQPASLLQFQYQPA